MAHRTRIKFCGITNPADATAAVEAGADAIGMVLHAPGAAREVTLRTAEQIVAVLPPFVQQVGVFRNAEPDLVLHAADRLYLDYAQIHGGVTPELVQDICAVKLLLSVRVDEHAADNLRRFRLMQNLCVTGVVLDSAEGGGSGVMTDWDQVEQLDLSGWPHAIFAGGLTPETVGEVVRRFRPHAVDVSSGIEGPRKGVKDVERMRAFVAAVRDADAANVTV